MLPMEQFMKWMMVFYDNDNRNNEQQLPAGKVSQVLLSWDELLLRQMQLKTPARWRRSKVGEEEKMSSIQLAERKRKLFFYVVGLQPPGQNAHPEGFIA